MNIGEVNIANHLLLSKTMSRQLKKIVALLFDHYLIGYFGYNRFYRNRKWIGIYSDPFWVEKSLRAGEMPLFIDKHGVFIEAGVYFFRDIKDIFKTKILSDYVERFFSGVDDKKACHILENALLIVRKGETYDESFFFSLRDGNNLARAYFYQINGALKQFCQFFLHKAKGIIEGAEKHKVPFYPPPAGCELFPGLYQRHNGLSNEWLLFDSKKFCVGTPFGDVFLSYQELNCLRLISCGFTGNQIGEQLGIQNKTVESYILNLKNKLTVNSRSELAAIYRNFSILDHFNAPQVTMSSPFLSGHCEYEKNV